MLATVSKGLPAMRTEANAIGCPSLSRTVPNTRQGRCAKAEVPAHHTKRERINRQFIRDMLWQENR